MKWPYVVAFGFFTLAWIVGFFEGTMEHQIRFAIVGAMWATAAKLKENP